MLAGALSPKEVFVILKKYLSFALVVRNKIRNKILKYFMSACIIMIKKYLSF
jgi:hypothetical protein